MDWLEYENKALSEGYNIICGVDEAGRGPLAGPVYAAAVILPKGHIIEGINDSKKLSEKKRELLAEKIKQKAVAYVIAQSEAEEIDEINILNCVKKRMTEAVKNLSVKPDAILIDGNDTHLDLDNAEYVVKGDGKSYTVGCASIVAKVYRDNLMKEYAKEFPGYGFEKHKGYGTKVHIDKIKETGPCRLHRKTFIKNFWDGQEK